MTPAVALSPSGDPKPSLLARANTVLQTIVRYLLCIGMLPYAISKLCNFQFQLPAYVYPPPLGEIPGASLTWAFLGYQPWFQFLLGVLEFVPAVLLLFRRTRRLGAVLLLPVVLNVALMNYAIDLWPETQLISTVFLVMTLYLLACDVPLWRRFLAGLLHRPAFNPSRLRTAGNVAEIVAAPLIVAGMCVFFYSQVNALMPPVTDFVGKRQINGAGRWIVRHISVDGRDLPITGDPLVYFDFANRARYVNGAQNTAGTFSVDRDHRHFKIGPIGLPNLGAIEGTYHVAGAT